MINHLLHHEASHENFIVHLQARLDLKDEAAAVAKLGDWLSSYDPGPAALALATSRPLAHRDAA